MRLTDECGAPWYRISSWRLWRNGRRQWRFFELRALPERIGYAYGPIMFFWRQP